MEQDRWLGIELRHLAALEAVAREGSFGRGAEALGYTQSAVSQQIAALERAVGERLLERPGGSRRISLTEAGTLLLRHAREITARLAAAKADLAALSAGATGLLRVGTFPSVGARLLPAVLRRFSASWPGVTIQLSESPSDTALLEGVARGNLDLVFTVAPVTEGPLETIELMRDPWLLVVPADSPLATSGRPPTLRDLGRLPLIGSRDCRASDRMEEGLRARGIEPRVVFRSADNGTVQGLVGAGVGSAPMCALAYESGDPRTVALPMEPLVPPRLIGLAWHRDRYHSPAARAFVETALAVCAEREEAAAA
jgi:DNA-binding transcriptional LysR family regulator